MSTRRLTISLPQLRWIAIRLPIGFVLATGAALHWLFEPAFGQSLAHALTGLIMVAGVVVFSLAIFRVLEEKERTILRHTRQAQAVHQIGAEVSALLDPDSLIRLVVARAHELLDVDAAGLARFDDDGGVLYWDHVVTRNRSDQRFRTMRLQPGEGIAGYVVATGKPLVIVDTALGLPDGVEWAPILESEGLRASAAVPLRAGERVFGALLVANRAPTVFKDDDVTLLTSLANQVAVALTNAELFTRAQMAAERLEQLIESSGDAIIVTDLDGRITNWNRGAEAIYGWTRDEAVGARLPMVPPDLRSEAEQIITDLVEHGAVLSNFETERLRRDGQRIQVVVTVSPIRGAGSAVVGMLGISKDMSAHRQLEQQQLRLTLLEDRERIGVELHDGAIQSLYAVGLGLETVAQVLDSDTAQARIRLEKARDGLNALIREIRNYIFGLRPESVMNVGLTAGLASLAQELQVNALVDVELDIADEVDEAFGAEHAEEIYQITREALRNVARHARAGRARLTLRPTDDAWLLYIWDNGVGFDPGDVSAACFGLGNMRARARRIGGGLSISGQPGQGTEIRLIVQPLEKGSIHDLDHAAAHSGR